MGSINTGWSSGKSAALPDINYHLLGGYVRLHGACPGAYG